MEDGLGSLLRELSTNAHSTGILVNAHSYPFTLSTAESHVDLGRTELFHGKTRRARTHHKYAMTDFTDAGEYKRAYRLAEEHGLLPELSRLFQKRIVYLNAHGMFQESAAIKDLMRRERDKEYEDLTETFKI